MIPSLLIAEKKASQKSNTSAEFEGITHYGMAIDEIKKIYHKDTAVLEIIYSKTLSDDNMDNYVKRFYDEFLIQIQKWLYANALPAQNMKIVISNCKFCKIGYCKNKNVKGISLVSYKFDSKHRQVDCSHIDIIDQTKYIDIAKSAVITLLEQ